MPAPRPETTEIGPLDSTSVLLAFSFALLKEALEGALFGAGKANSADFVWFLGNFTPWRDALAGKEGKRGTIFP